MPQTLGFHIDFVNYPYLAVYMTTVHDRTIKACNAAGSEIAELGINEIHARLYPGHGYRTGRLYHSYFKHVEGRGTVSFTVEWGTDLYYAPYVEYRWGGKVSHFRPAMAVVSQSAPTIAELHFSRIL